ncbi:hypothetical protein QJS04_geneDACA008271 [Acorus gramineus]|uniref:Reverse transcriptase n=1 Tax=Acorus gramineus TaxID=55184 RepID=A0AAV9AUT1_ACOGR|nr:hypothetical protein QJS04_geneDACA008271 [Acorus gramineus]
MFKFVKKLANTKQVLKRWNKEIYGPIHHTLVSHRCEMEEAQKALRQTPHDPLTMATEAEARLKYRNTLHQEEIFARQKSRQLWLAAGDSNTKFFYNSIKSRSVKNSICCLQQNDGNLCSSSEEIKDLIVQYYQELLNRNSSFFSQGKLLRKVNHSFIALIPKSLDAESLDQYRPISLCNTFYKLFTKIMALRFQSLLPKLISELRKRSA